MVARRARLDPSGTRQVAGEHAADRPGARLAAEQRAEVGGLEGEAGAGTIGGVFACNLAGPRRIKAGAARDHFLGAEAISGRGELFKSGGRVVKNVTGYDLCKLLAGSYGTLAAMTQVTVKVLPVPEKTRTVLVLGLDEQAGLMAMTRALASSHEVSGAAYLPAALILESEVSYVREAGTSVTALRIEGPVASVAYRCEALRKSLSDLGPTEELHGHNSAQFWAEIRDVRPFLSRPDFFVWRLSVPPQDGPAVVGRIAPRGDSFHFYDWGGGLIWLAVAPSPDAPGSDAQHPAVRDALAPCGGHATLVRAPDATRASIPVFQPQEPGLAALTRRVKESFDPKGVLNPGRMVAGG